MATCQKTKKSKTIYVDWMGVYADWTLPGATETINAKNFPMTYLDSQEKANELISTVSGETVSLVSNDFPKELLKSGKAKELRSKWS